MYSSNALMNTCVVDNVDIQDDIYSGPSWLRFPTREWLGLYALCTMTLAKLCLGQACSVGETYLSSIPSPVVIPQ